MQYKSLNILTTIVIKFVLKNFQKLPNLVTLIMWQVDNFLLFEGF